MDYVDSGAVLGEPFSFPYNRLSLLKHIGMYFLEGRLYGHGWRRLPDFGLLNNRDCRESWYLCGGVQHATEQLDVYAERWGLPEKRAGGAGAEPANWLYQREAAGT